MILLALLAAIAPPPPGRAVVGRVVDERRMPVAGAAVVARFAGIQSPVAATTTLDGSFELAAPEVPGSPTWTIASFSVVTRDRRIGHSLDQIETDRGNERDTFELRSAIVVGAGGVLEVEARDANGVVAGATIELQTRYRSPAVLVATTDARGRARIDPAPVGRFSLSLTGSGCGHAQEIEIAGGETASTTVELQRLHSFAVEVLDVDTSAPIPGATVTVLRTAEGENPGPFAGHNRYDLDGRGTPRTDARGRLTLDGFEAGSVLVVAATAEHFAGDERVGDPAPDLDPDARVGSSRKVAAEDGEVQLFLRRLEPRTIAWRILEGATPPPVDGTLLDVTLFEGSHRLAGRSGRGVVRDGVVAMMVERLPRRGPIDRRAVDYALPGLAISADGAIAWLRLEGHGPNGIAAFARGANLTVRLLATDGAPRPLAELYAELEDVSSDDGGERPRQQSRVFADASGMARLGPLWPGRWKLAAEGIERIVDLSDGDVSCDLAPPPQSTLVVEFTVGGERQLPSDLDVHVMGECRSLRREDPARGEVRLSIARPAVGVPFEVLVSCGERGTARRQITPTSESDVIRVAIDVDAEVRGHEPLPAWNDPSIATVRVVWKVPEGENADFLAVEMAGGVKPRRPGRLFMDLWPFHEEGATRELRFQRANPPKLVVHHPYLVGSRWNDAIKLEHPREAVTLHVEAGPLVTMTPELPTGSPAIRGAFVTLAPSDGTDGEVEVLPALRRGAAFVLAPPPAGERCVLVDPVVAAPAELGPVEFTGAPQDLGTIRFARGSTLRVHTRVAAPFAPPRARVIATRLDGLGYDRSPWPTERDATPELTEIRGLGPGRFRVTVNAFYSGAWSTEVVVDGEHDAELTIDLD